MFCRLRTSDRRAVVAHDVGPRLDGLVAVGGAQDVQAGDRPQRRELLDGLVGRAVFADADRVVGEDEADLRRPTAPRGGWAGRM